MHTRTAKLKQEADSMKKEVEAVKELHKHALELLHLLEDLKSFVSLNQNGFLRIIKKYDHKAGTHTRHHFYQYLLKGNTRFFGKINFKQPNLILLGCWQRLSIIFTLFFLKTNSSPVTQISTFLKNPSEYDKFREGKPAPSTPGTKHARGKILKITCESSFFHTDQSQFPD